MRDNKKMVILSLIAIFFITIDRWFKAVAINFLNEQTLGTSWFKLNLNFNQNIAFSLPLQGIILNALIIILIIILITAYLHLRSKNYYLKSGWLLIIIFGSISNMFDRIKYGAVIDYLDLKYFTVFNIADVMIVVGALSLICLELKKPKS
ncbi:MAG: signal peptidase II [bacterium]